MGKFKLEKMQDIISSMKLDGWLFYDFRGSNDLALNILEKGYNNLQVNKKDNTALIYAFHDNKFDFAMMLIDYGFNNFSQWTSNASSI